jgi:hypothetical protein
MSLDHRIGGQETTLRGLARFALLGCVLVACSAPVSRSAELDTERGEREIRQSLERAYGTSVTAVNCPQRAAKRGDRFQCTAWLEGETLRVDVTQKDDEGSITFAPAQAVLDLQRAVSVIERSIAEQTGVTARVSCGHHRLVVKDPGASFDCEAIGLPDGPGRVVVTVKDVEGNVDFRLG